MSEDNVGRIIARINEHMNAIYRQQNGSARQAEWHCEDGWIVIYTTTRVQGGPHDSNFLAQLFKPGRGKDRDCYVQDDRRVCATRREAKERAVTWYRQHSPKWDAKHPVVHE